VVSPPRKRTTIELFFDCVSPYSWLGFEVLCRYRNIWNLDLQLKPFFLGGVMQASGNQPPAMLPAKAAYMTGDVDRLGRLFNVPTKQPSDFGSVMGSTLPIQRILCAVSLAHPDKVEGVARSFWLRIWSRDLDIGKPESQREALLEGGVPESSIARLLTSLKDSRVKDELKKNTDRAVATGAFGAPHIIVHTPDGKQQMIFGSDRFEMIAMMIGAQWQGPDPFGVGVLPPHKPSRGGAAARSRM